MKDHPTRINITTSKGLFAYKNNINHRQFYFKRKKKKYIKKHSYDVAGVEELCVSIWSWATIYAEKSCEKNYTFCATKVDANVV